MTWKMWNCGNRNVEMEMWKWKCGNGTVEIEMWKWKWLSSNIVKSDQKLCCVVLLDGFKLCYNKTTKRQRFPTQSDLILL